MSGQGLGNVAENSFEDFVDDFTTTVVMRNAKKVFDPLKKDLEGSDTAFDEALSGAIATLQMGISMLAIRYVTTTLLPNLALRGIGIYSYIVGGRIVKGISKSMLKTRLGRVKSGRLLGKALSIFTDGAKERAHKAQIANDMVMHFDTIKSRKEKIANDTRLSMDSTYSNANASFANKSLALYTEKTKSGTWTKSNVDKKIYEKATGSKLQSGVSWSKLSSKLNQFSEFARSAEDEIVSLAQVNLDHMTANGVTKVN